MTAATVKTARVTNLIVSPNVVDTNYQRNSLIVDTEVVPVLTTNIDDVGDAIIMMPLPSGVNLVGLKVYNTDMDSAGPSLTYDLGFVTLEAFDDISEQTNIRFGATHYNVYDAVGADNLICDAQTGLGAANLTGAEIRYANDATLATAGKRVWDWAGLSYDPHKLFALKLIVEAAAATAAAGTLVIQASYIPW